MSTGEVIVKVMDLLRKGEISRMTPNGEVYRMVSSKKDFRRIEKVLEWYECTYGSEQENASDEMYKILLNLYNQELKWQRLSKQAVRR